MKATDLLRISLDASHGMVMGLIDDMKDAALTQPTSNGGNHPLWVLGHLAHGEAELVREFIHGEPNPLDDWKELFGGGTEPVPDAGRYPPLEEIKTKFEEVRFETLKYLDTLSDEDLDGPSKGCPPGLEACFGTIGLCLMMLSLHSMNHRGQVADARRVAGRKPLMA